MLGLILGNWQRIALYGVLALLVAGLLELDGFRRGEKKLFDYQAKQLTESVRIVTKQGAVTQKVVTKYVKVREETQAVANGIRNEVIRYVETNPGSCLDRQWGRLHDAAALDTVPVPASVADGSTGAPTASAAIQTVTANYAGCWANAERLEALQAWVTEQAAVR